MLKAKGKDLDSQTLVGKQIEKTCYLTSVISEGCYRSTVVICLVEDSWFSIKFIHNSSFKCLPSNPEDGKAYQQEFVRKCRALIGKEISQVRPITKNEQSDLHWRTN